MSPKERLTSYLFGQKVDRVPFVYMWGPWPETVRRWLNEGMNIEDGWQNFGFDSFHHGTGVNYGICPPFEEKILADEGETVVWRDCNGIILRDRKDQTSMPQFLEYPVKDRAGWERHKWRFDPDTPERFPDDWDQKAKELNSSDVAVSLGSTYPYGFFGGARTMMGAEACLMAFALDPELIHEINSHLCNLWHKLWSRIMETVRIDVVFFWEDMAGKNGSLISPAMFRRFMTPYYKKLTNLCSRHGIKLFLVDSDGNLDELAELWLEAGINCIFPWEVQAGNDIAIVRKKYPSLGIIGGMDKRAVAKGHAAIDAEITRISEVLPHGRLIPCPDHGIPPDISWENYQYFVQRWKEMVGKKD